MKFSLFLLYLVILPVFAYNQTKTCEIIGKVSNRQSDYLIVKKITDKRQAIPIAKINLETDGSFHYDLPFHEIESFSLNLR